MRWLARSCLCLILMSSTLGRKDFDFSFEGENGGAVKTFVRGRWFSVCQSPYSSQRMPVNNVICKSMGFKYSSGITTVYRRSRSRRTEAVEFGRGMKCTGSEASISLCRGFSYQIHTCRYGLVQVKCQGQLKQSSINPVKVECQDMFNVSIDAGKFHKYFTDVDPKKLTLADQTCPVQNDGYMYSVIAAFDKCGTIEKETDTAILYTNHLTYTDASGSRIKLQTLTCSMSRQMQVKQSVKAVPDSVMVATGHGNFLVSMDVYKDTTFKTKKVGPIITRPGVVLYLKLELKSSSTDGLNIVAQDCHSTPSLGSTQTTPLISDRCPVEKSIKLIQSTKPTNQVLMSVKTQALKNVDSDVVYIVCNVTICQDSDRSRRCRQECGGSNNRTKREAEFELPSASLYKGPFVVVPQNQQQEILGSPWILSVAGVGILTVGVIVGSLRRRSKHI